MISKEFFQNEEWYKVVCDNCNDSCIDEEGSQCLMPDELSAKNLAVDEDWLIRPNEHLCKKCTNILNK